MRLSIPFAIIPFASRKPPMKRKIIGLANCVKASSIGAIPNSTQRVGPKIEVTRIGIGSVIHQIATRLITAKRWCAASERPAIGKNQINTAHCEPRYGTYRLANQIKSRVLLFHIFFNLRCKNTTKIARVQLFYKKVQKKFGHVKKK